MADIRELELKRRQREAMEAKALLEHPLLQKTLNGMLDDIHSQWECTKFDQHARRESLYTELLAVKRFEKTLKGVINGGRIAEFELQSREESSADG